MADNTKQFRWIVTIQGNLDGWYRERPDVFVAGDLLWYPVEGHPEVRMAPDALVAFGRPKGERGSYLQWREDGIAPQVVFEIWSPGNLERRKQEKFEFYERYGVEEYYTYDPDTGLVEGWVRGDEGLEPIAEMQGWVSPRLSVHFEIEAGELALYLPDGRKFEPPAGLMARLEAEREAKEKAWAKLRALGIDPESL